MEQLAEIALLRSRIALRTKEINLMKELITVEEELASLQPSDRSWLYKATLKTMETELVTMGARLNELDKADD